MDLDSSDFCYLLLQADGNWAAFSDSQSHDRTISECTLVEGNPGAITPTISAATEEQPEISSGSSSIRPEDSDSVWSGFGRPQDDNVSSDWSFQENGSLHGAAPLDSGLDWSTTPKVESEFSVVPQLGSDWGISKVGSDWSATPTVDSDWMTTPNANSDWLATSKVDSDSSTNSQLNSDWTAAPVADTDWSTTPEMDSDWLTATKVDSDKSTHSKLDSDWMDFNTSSPVAETREEASELAEKPSTLPLADSLNFTKPQVQYSHLHSLIGLSYASRPSLIS